MFVVCSVVEKEKKFEIKILILSFYIVIFCWNNKGLMSEFDGVWEKLKRWIEL